MTADSDQGRGTAPDQEQRDLILSELDINMLVEAAAGTGKTTSIIGRMLALLRQGKCLHIRHMAAVTFTRKAAAELRSRFQIELEKASQETEGEQGDRLEQALANIEQAYIGTIHSFCARLLRERPVEARIDLAFTEIDEEADQRLCEEAWEEYTAKLIAGDDPEGLLRELIRLGLNPNDLKGAFTDFATFPDVDEWPLPPSETEPLDLDRVGRELEGYVAHMEEVAPSLPEEYGNDKLIPAFKRLPRVLSHYDDLGQPEQLMELLTEFDKGTYIVQKEWKKSGIYDGEDAKEEKARWERFREDVVKPALHAWRERRYGIIMRMMLQAREVYDELRRERGVLNFADLLMKAAALLRENPNVRRYFCRRFTHLLIDEFQDTDPIQAEVLLLLTSQDPEEMDWRRCKPRPGSLFVVGDPKQSIYRFRRADIVTYNEVKKVLQGKEAGGGRIIRLEANFRAISPVIDWVNQVFEPGEKGQEDTEKAMLRFPAEESQQSPAYVHLKTGREEGDTGLLQGLFRLQVPENFSRKEDVISYETDLIARVIRHALDTEMTVPRTRRQLEEGKGGAVGPSDFMIITPKKANLADYARALQEYGIPHQVTGGSALNEVEELKLLHTCMKAVVHPDDPVALVAALRSELFGISDAALYAFKKAGGGFNYNSPIPQDLSQQEGQAFKDVYGRLKKYSLWLTRMPPAAALERTAGDLGLPALACAKAGGDVEAGSLAKAMELLRGVQPEMWTTAHIVDYLGQLVEAKETYDGISARSGERPAVRIMNLHKVKGLEASVVFLADPSGEFDHDVGRYIDRSSDRITGYMAIYGRKWGRSRAKLLAHPSDWESLTEREKGFLKAEALRLRYVAATRSGAATIITQREKGNENNPWRYFVDYLPLETVLADPGPQSAPPGDKETMPEGAVEKAEAAIAARLEQAGKMTYDSRGAKEYSLSLKTGTESIGDLVDMADGFPPPPPSEEGEHGIEWGTVIHLLLQLAMQEPQADLVNAAQAALAENGLDPELVESATGIIRSVMASQVWKRAQQSDHCLTEVPFQVLREEAGEVPTVLRGAIDLIFKEEDGWVLVDYKTDSLAGKKPGDLAGKYAPQVRLYASAWERCTDEVVKETALYFTQADLLIPLP
jgi:ATP-dependent helicase/nuclease subunit A